MSSYFEPSPAVVIPANLSSGTLGLVDAWPHDGDGVILTAAAGAWAFGAWATIVAAATLASHVLLGIYWRQAASANLQLQIGVGPAGSEVPIARFAFNNNISVLNDETIMLPIPVQITANLRVSARCESNIGNTTGNVYIYTLPRPF